jgi:hypothetical protein
MDLPDYAFSIIQAVGFIKTDGHIYGRIHKNKAGGTWFRALTNSGRCV